MSKLLQSSDASTAPGLQNSLEELSCRYAAAQSSQTQREAELKALLPRLESYERLGADLQLFTQSRLKALSPAGQPDRSVDDYRQTMEVSRGDRGGPGSGLRDRRVGGLTSVFVPVLQEVKSELEQEAGQLKTFCSLGTELSQSDSFTNTQSLLDHVQGVSAQFNQLQEDVDDRWDQHLVPSDGQLFKNRIFE